MIRGNLKLVQHRARLNIGLVSLAWYHAKDTPPTRREKKALLWLLRCITFCFYEEHKLASGTVTKTISHKKNVHIFATFLQWVSACDVAEKRGCCLVFRLNWASGFITWGRTHHLSGDRTPLGYLWRNVIHSRLTSLLSKVGHMKLYSVEGIGT